MSDYKPYFINLENRGGYLYVLVGGDSLTPEISRMYWDEIAAECEKIGCRKIMIEKDFRQTVSPPEMLQMGVYLGSILGSRKIAFLDRHGNEDINDLGKKMARNQGVIMQVFQNVRKAESWLLAEGV